MARTIPFDDRIKERDCGEFKGKGFESLDRDLYWNYYDATKYEKAESIEHLFNRVFDFLNEIKEKYKDKTILLVTSRVNNSLSIALDIISIGDFCGI